MSKPNDVIPMKLRWALNQIKGKERKRELTLRWMAFCDGGTLAFGNGVAWILKITEKDEKGDWHLIAFTTIVDLI